MSRCRGVVIACWVVLLLLAGSSVARGQVVAGTVTDSATGAPVNGAVVVLLGAEGAMLGSAFTDDSGAYQVRVGVPQSVRVRAERIGFGGHLGPLIPVGAGETVRHDVRLVRRVAALRAVEVRADRQCAAMREADLAMVELWQDIRAALQGAAATRAENAIIYDYTVFERERSRDGRELRMQRVTRRTTRGARAFAAVDIGSLERDGYVVPDGDGWEYRAPDAEVLLSDSFLETHCFRNVVHPTARDSLIGLGFEPVEGLERSDVTGVLWVDRDTRELRRIDFSYTGLDLPVPTDELGGWVEFRQTPTGRWIVNRWLLRMPVITGRQERRGGMGGSVRTTTRYTLSGFREAGGDVAFLTGNDGKPLRVSAGGSLAGTVYDSVRKAPLFGARVTLPGTPYEAVTDQRGRFSIDSVPSGEYMVSASHPLIDSLGVGAPSRFVQLLTGDTTSVDLATPPLPRVRERLCPALGRDDDPGMLHGTVRDAETGRPVANAEVTVTWSTWRLSGGVAQRQTSGTAARTTSDGRYVLCGVPTDMTLEIGAVHDAYDVATASMVLGELPVAMQDLEQARKK